MPLESNGVGGGERKDRSDKSSLWKKNLKLENPTFMRDAWERKKGIKGVSRKELLRRSWLEADPSRGGKKLRKQRFPYHGATSNRTR